MEASRQRLSRQGTASYCLRESTHSHSLVLLQAVNDHASVKRLLSLLAQGRTLAAEEGARQCVYSPHTFSPNYSWIRVKAPSEFTTIHADIFYYKVRVLTYCICCTTGAVVKCRVSV